MEPLLELLREAGQAAIGLFTLPYYYVAIIMVWWHVRANTKLQRKLYHVRLYSSLYLVVTRVFAGIAIGLILSLVSVGIGSRLTDSTLVCIWIGMAVLALFRLRYICFAYAAGALGVLQVVLSWTGIGEEGSLWYEPLQTVVAIDVPSLMIIAGLLHVAEGIIIRVQSGKQAIPLYFEGKRGNPIGAYSLSGVWPIPLLWLIPGEGAALPWTPLFGMTDHVASWGFLAFPLVIAFSERTTTKWPEVKARSTGNLLIIYGVVITALAVGAFYWSPLSLVAALAAFLLHDGLMHLSTMKEAGHKLLYANDRAGVRVLAVLPHTPAVEMEFQAGEIITKVNGATVRTKEQFHVALGLQSAFSKLEVINREGHVRFIQRARYAGEHYHLGLLLAPDEDAEYVASPNRESLWNYVRYAGIKRRRGQISLLQEAINEAAAEVEKAVAETASIEEQSSNEIEEAPPVDPGLPPRGMKK
ncbi:MAG: PDZ domain-containing protein [Candidatus Cohnella colombiensis]|uniref:PDZ domain-containing protein n=1 Tax=Candidatus Cohnella colombiensis TaxID=3121368 RepID=A0AA95EXM0_9BACL|nr:MAG: PDZ domain-containing protein [Cohnella sp.]